jgi:hypothetical protein
MGSFSAIGIEQGPNENVSMGSSYGLEYDGLTGQVFDGSQIGIASVDPLGVTMHVLEGKKTHQRPPTT